MKKDGLLIGLMVIVLLVTVCFLTEQQAMAQERDNVSVTNSKPNSVSGDLVAAGARVFARSSPDTESFSANGFRGEIRLLLRQAFFFDNDMQRWENSDGHVSFGHHAVGGRWNPISTWAPALWGGLAWIWITRPPAQWWRSGDGFSPMGCIAGFDVELKIPKRGRGRFLLSWFPQEKVFYKSMYVTWPIGPVNIEFGGSGVRRGDRIWTSAFSLGVGYQFSGR